MCDSFDEKPFIYSFPFHKTSFCKICVKCSN